MAGSAAAFAGGAGADCSGGRDLAVSARQARTVVVVVGRDGRILGLELTGPGFDYGQGFRELAEQLGVAVVVTVAARRHRQQCMALMPRTLGRWQGRLKPALPRKLLRLAVHLPERWR